MNLVDDPWIPVIFQNGENKTLSLAEAYSQENNIRDVVANPIQRIALMRLLICITQTALDGPKDEEDWVNCRQRMPNACLQYLKREKNRFNLYGPSAFLQVPTLEPIRNSSLDKLDLALASGHNPNLFDHEATPKGRVQDDAKLPLMLLSYQCFSPGGTIGVGNWGRDNTPGEGSSEHAPCVAGSALHTLIRTYDLLSTIHANLLTKTQVDSLPKNQTTWGRPIWEFDLSVKDNRMVEQITHSYLGRLVPLSRAILLEPGLRKFSLANGLSYPKLPAARETTGTVVLRGKGEKARESYVPVDISRHPWRELGSILAMNQDRALGGALALEHLDPATDEVVDIWTGGLATDRGKKIDMDEWILSVPTSLLNESELNSYQAGVGLAQKGIYALDVAIKEYCSEQSLANTLSPKCRNHYWSDLDRHSNKLMTAATDHTTSLNDTWYPLVRKAMRKAYDFACPHQTPRQVQAYAKGLLKLRLKKLEQ